jgi:threonyl-tRNA synthetase
MRLLLIHADSFEYRVTEKTSVAGSTGELEESMAQGKTGDALIAFLASEKADEDGIESVVEQVAEVLTDHAHRVDTSTVMIYPYAHLSSELSSPRVATKVLDEIYRRLVEAGDLKVERAPFGYYKAFDISCKGHPLSELAQTIVPAKGAKAGEDEAGVSTALKSEKTLKSDWMVCSPEGDIVPAKEFEFKKYPDFKAMYDYEIEGSRISEEPPPHIELMRRLELVDYEPGSDPGNFRWYPKGKLIKSLLETYVANMVIDYGGMPVETPIMYDFEHPKLSSYLHRFPARQYILKSDKKEYFLRFAACFGQYLIQHDMNISYNHLPLRLFELTHYSFRREQSGELAGLKRLRTFTMPDLHTLAQDFDSAKEEFMRQVELSNRCVLGFEVDGQIAVRFVREVFERNRDLVTDIARLSSKPVLIELWDERFFYFVAKFELNFVDALKKTSCLSTVQIDVENTERFDITFVDRDGERKNPLLLHTSISGSIDRVVYAMLETQAIKMKRGEKPSLPFWLSPVQVRLIPVSEQFEDFASQLMDRIPFRCDLDDRGETVKRSIRDAEKAWIPYIVVIGEKEASGGPLSVRSRTGEQETLSVDDFIDLLKSRQSDFPYNPLNLPLRLSKRPIFIG